MPYLRLDEFIATAGKPVYSDVGGVGDTVMRKILIGYDTPKLVFDADPHGQRIGTYGRFTVFIVDKTTHIPKMQVSDEFKRLQTPELVRATNAWLAKFFDTVPSIMTTHGGDAMMTRETLTDLMNWGMP